MKLFEGCLAVGVVTSFYYWLKFINFSFSTTVLCTLHSQFLSINISMHRQTVPYCILYHTVYNTVPRLEVCWATCKQYIIVMPVQATKTVNIYYSGPHNKPHSLIVLISFFIPVINKDLKASHQAVSLAAVWDIKLETKTRLRTSPSKTETQMMASTDEMTRLNFETKPRCL